MSIFKKDFTESARSIYAANKRFNYTPSKLEVAQEIWATELNWEERHSYIELLNVSGKPIGEMMLDCVERLMMQINWVEASKAVVAQ